MRVAQGGINFSGGQRQRLAIARAVIRRPAIYLFDDAFSALDVHTDARVRAALREMSGGATVIVVTQRISTAAQADQVIVVDDGKLVGAGTHESLLADCATYAEFADSQSVGACDRSAGHAVTAAITPPGRGAASPRRAVPRLLGLGDPAGETAYAATGAERRGDRAGHHRHRDRRRRPADPRPRHRPAVQRRHRATSCRRESPRSRPSPRPGPAVTTPSPTCCPG